MTLNYLKQRVYDIFESDNPDPKDIANKIIDWTVIVFIFLSVISVILETVPWVHTQPTLVHLLRVVEIVSVVVFTLEYILRFWSITIDPRYSQPFWGRIRFFFTFMSIIDVMAIAPFYFTAFAGMTMIDLRFLRMLRMVRLLRVLKLARYSAAIQNIFKVISLKKADILVAISIVIMLTLLSSSVLYFVEHEAQPDKFTSIPDSMWWAICTLTTVGYGDIFPITWLGKIITAFITLLSLGIIALPAGIIVTGYQEVAAMKAKKIEVKESIPIEKRIEKIEILLQEIKSKL